MISDTCTKSYHSFVSSVSKNGKPCMVVACNKYCTPHMFLSSHLYTLPPPACTCTYDFLICRCMSHTCLCLPHPIVPILMPTPIEVLDLWMRLTSTMHFFIQYNVINYVKLNHFDFQLLFDQSLLADKARLLSVSAPHTAS